MASVKFMQGSGEGLPRSELLVSSGPVKRTKSVFEISPKQSVLMQSHRAAPVYTC